MNRWSQVIALGILLGLLLATFNYYYQARQYSRFTSILAERSFLYKEIKEFNKKTGEWPKSIAGLPPNPKFEGWTLELLSADQGAARFRVKKGQHVREIKVSVDPSTHATTDERGKMNVED